MRALMRLLRRLPSRRVLPPLHGGYKPRPSTNTAYDPDRSPVPPSGRGGGSRHPARRTETPMPEIDHPHTDPGDGRVECSTCGKWVHLVTHSCKRIPVTARARLRQQPTRDVERGAAIIASLKRDTATTEQAPIRYIRVQINRDDAHTIVEFVGGARACSCGLERGAVPSLRASHPRSAQ